MRRRRLAIFSNTLSVMAVSIYRAGVTYTTIGRWSLRDTWKNVKFLKYRRGGENNSNEIYVQVLQSREFKVVVTLGML